MPAKMTDSPIVEAVRQAREQIAKDNQYDLRKMLKELRKDERASGKPTRSPYDSKTGSK
ncbi:MAG: hypothetical protein K8R91_03860 [Phycisphaerae bacterium]|nr:hypothetical protein [Phycisphaerae bacterium]